MLAHQLTCVEQKLDQTNVSETANESILMRHITRTEPCISTDPEVCGSESTTSTTSASDSHSEDSSVSESDISVASPSKSIPPIPDAETSDGTFVESSSLSGNPSGHRSIDTNIALGGKSVRRSLKQAIEYASCLMDTLSTMEQVFNIVTSKSRPDACMEIAENGGIEAKKRGSDVTDSIHSDRMNTVGSLGPAWPYYTKVKDMFSGVADPLARRLAETNWERHISLRSGKVPFTENASKSFKSGATIITQSTFVDSGFAGSEDIIVNQPSLHDSDTSYRTTETSVKRGSLRVPAPPSGFYSDDPFECSICSKTVFISTRAQWK